MKIGKTLYVSKRKTWRAWLAKNHRKEKEIWLIYPKKHTGTARIPYNDAVEEALCFGWIDSIVKRIDEDKYAQRYSPRRRTSILSQLNLERIRKLIANKKITPVGLAAVSHVFNPGSDTTKFKIPSEILFEIKKNADAWKNFQRLPDHYKRIRIAYIEHRKLQGNDAFRSSLEHFIKMTAKNKRFGFMRD
ncbi:YdeI/OmpD-associated family protein [Candidatus Micrarchaeota archaeon]|nr:YdeI/OmpD-associated family protein [Candidatus Micrarchaeota archaeon]